MIALVLAKPCSWKALMCRSSVWGKSKKDCDGGQTHNCALCTDNRLALSIQVHIFRALHKFCKAKTMPLVKCK